jgi:hypothetical protein
MDQTPAMQARERGGDPTRDAEEKRQLERPLLYERRECVTARIARDDERHTALVLELERAKGPSWVEFCTQAVESFEARGRVG